MKIVDVCAFYAPQGGGVRTYVDRKLALGPSYGHEIVVVAPGAEDATERRGPGARIEWVAAPRLPLDTRYRYFDDPKKVVRRLDAERPDFVEASSPWRTANIVAEWQGSAPRSLIMHSDPLAAYAYRWLEPIAAPEQVDRQFAWFWQRLQRLTLEFDAVICASASLTARLAEHGISRPVTNPMGVSDRLFSPGLRDEGLRARMLARCGLPPEACLLLAVGRHAPEKRWPMVVEAVMAVGYERPLGLVLVGDGRERSRIARMVDGNPHIHLVAPIGDRRALARLMASADALVHGCEAETFSMVAAEAAASGLPLIVPDRGGAADHAAANDGFTYEAGSAADAARAIRAFLDAGVRPTPKPVRTIEDHFRDLFALYERLGRLDRSAA